MEKYWYSVGYSRGFMLEKAPIGPEHFPTESALEVVVQGYQDGLAAREDFEEKLRERVARNSVAHPVDDADDTGIQLKS